VLGTTAHAVGHELDMSIVTRHERQAVAGQRNCYSTPRPRVSYRPDLLNFNRHGHLSLG
jgi:hypothetical protein